MSLSPKEKERQCLALSGEMAPLASAGAALQTRAAFEFCVTPCLQAPLSSPQDELLQQFLRHLKEKLQKVPLAPFHNCLKRNK